MSNVTVVTIVARRQSSGVEFGVALVSIFAIIALQDVPEVQRAYEEYKRFSADPVMREKARAREIERSKSNLYVLLSIGEGDIQLILSSTASGIFLAVDITEKQRQRRRLPLY